MPYDGRRNSGQKSCNAPQLTVVVVEPRNDERNDLKPNASLVQTFDRPQYTLQFAAELPVIPGRERLQIDFVETEKWKPLFFYVTAGKLLGSYPLTPSS